MRGCILYCVSSNKGSMPAQEDTLHLAQHVETVDNVSMHQHKECLHQPVLPDRIVVNGH